MGIFGDIFGGDFDQHLSQHSSQYHVQSMYSHLRQIGKRKKTFDGEVLCSYCLIPRSNSYLHCAVITASSTGCQIRTSTVCMLLKATQTELSRSTSQG